MDMQKRWIILFVALLSISFLGLFYSGHEGMFTDIDSNLNFADIALPRCSLSVLQQK